MLKTMIAAIFMAACTLFVSAQNCPPLGNRTNGITTNPAAPVNTHRPSRLNWFDWTQPSYLLNLGVTNISATSIPSPFFTTDNGNIVHFYDPADGIRDVSPAQGWELIKMDFGYVNNTTPASPGTTQPYMILYNKFRGILRVFFATVQTFPVTGATVRVVFSSNSGMQTSLLDYQASLKPVDAAFERNPELTSVVEYLQQPLRWWYADYPMQYDPCTCLYSSSLEIHLVFDNVSNINLAGTST